jgi:V/A-type H+/Na+-transporting ATPase subunit F
LRRVVILTDSDTADGFRLAGVETMEGKEGDTAGNKAKILSLVNDDDVGIVGVSEEYFSELDEATRAKIERLERPIIVTVPVTKHLEASEARHAYLAKMIRRAIGFDIKIGGEA